MAKKKAEDIDLQEAEEILETPELRLTADFGREDLNDMRDAINELFQR